MKIKNLERNIIYYSLKLKIISLDNIVKINIYDFIDLMRGLKLVNWDF